MFPAQASRIDPDEFSRCEELEQKTDQGKSPSSGQKTDASLKESIKHALWKDDVLRAIEYFEIEVHVKNGVAYLNGHLSSSTSRSRIETAIRAISGLRGLQNNLVLDDKLTLEVATSLAELEHTYGCKFFTGSSHGVISLNGIVNDENVKLLAEQCVSRNPHVRGVVNNVRVAGTAVESADRPLMQPSIGAIIYFLDGVSGVVKQVVINPNNRRVIAMILWGRFVDQLQELKSLNNGESRSLERLAVIPLEAVRYLTRTSGFLHISSNDGKDSMDFDPAAFGTPDVNWIPPYPYCPDDVLFPIEIQNAAIPDTSESQTVPDAVASKEGPFSGEQLVVNDSLGG